MLNSASQNRKRLLAGFCLIGYAGFFAAAAPPASAQFKAWVMAKLPDRDNVKAFCLGGHR